MVLVSHGIGCSDLEEYLSEKPKVFTEEFDILGWWKVNAIRFPVLSQMARDVLAMPISTVASESAFSTGGRIINDFRSSLTPRMVQSLVCAQDWMRKTAKAINVEETPSDMIELEKGMVIYRYDKIICFDCLVTNLVFQINLFYRYKQIGYSCGTSLSYNR